MKNLIALTLLVAGVCVAATAGSRLGAEQGARLPAEGQTAIASRSLAQLAACEEKATAALEEEDADPAAIAEDRTACEERALELWGGDRAVAESAKTMADARLERAGRLEPGTRLSSWLAVAWPQWAGGLVLIVAGAVLGRRAAYESATGTHHEGPQSIGFLDGVARLRAAIDELLAEVRALEDGADAPAARERIEQLETDILAPIVESRDRYKARFGIAAFAEFFGPFSGGERNMARAWSALTDGYPHVAVEALEQAELSFSQAAEAFERVSA